MATPSVGKLCKQLISLAIQRCRLSVDICRLSVQIKRSQAPDSHLIRISISDTGAGSTLAEFHDLKYSFNGISDGMLSIITTCIGDNEIHHYKLNLKEASPSRRAASLPSKSKNNTVFSGTEVSLSTAENLDVLVTDLTIYLQKMLILKPQNVAVELMAEVGNHHLSQGKNVMVTNGASLPLTASSNVGNLSARLEEFVHKHRFHSTEKCQSCFPSGEHLKLGTGVAFSDNHIDNNHLIVEAALVISELPEPSNCASFQAQDFRSEVLYFKEYSPSSIHPLVLNSLKSINWDAYGLTLGSITDHDGSAFLEWENLPLDIHIDIALHCYNKQLTMPPLKQGARLEAKLVKKSVNAALNDLKEKYTGSLLSAHALKIRDYAPDLAKSIAGLILSSEDHNFRGECLSLLGVKKIGSNGDNLVVERCIKEKIISAIETNDRNTSRSRDPQPFLFDSRPYDLRSQPNCTDDDDEEGEEGYSFMEC